jgi:hypothetical protein
MIKSITPEHPISNYTKLILTVHWLVVRTPLSPYDAALKNQKKISGGSSGTTRAMPCRELSLRQRFSIFKDKTQSQGCPLLLLTFLFLYKCHPWHLPYGPSFGRSNLFPKDLWANKGQIRRERIWRALALFSGLQGCKFAKVSVQQGCCAEKSGRTIRYLEISHKIKSLLSKLALKQEYCRTHARPTVVL